MFQYAAGAGEGGLNIEAPRSVVVSTILVPTQVPFVDTLKLPMLSCQKSCCGYLGPWQY